MTVSIKCRALHMLQGSECSARGAYVRAVTLLCIDISIDRYEEMVVQVAHRTLERLQAFCGDVHLGLQGNVNVTVGPIGRDASASVNVGQRGYSCVYSYSCSRGAFLGVSVDGTVTHTRSNANLAFYGRPLTAKDLLLGGSVEPPPAARTLYAALNSMLNSFGYSQLAGRSMHLQHSAAVGAALQLPLDATYSVDDFSSVKQANAEAAAAQAAQAPAPPPAPWEPRQPLVSIVELPNSVHGGARPAAVGAADAAMGADMLLEPSAPAVSSEARSEASEGGLPGSGVDGTSEMSDDLPYALFDD